MYACIDFLVQQCRKSRALVKELLQTCTKPLICHPKKVKSFISESRRILSQKQKHSQQNKFRNGVLVSEYIYGLVQECSISIANALEILQSCTKPSILCRMMCSPLGKGEAPNVNKTRFCCCCTTTFVSHCEKTKHVFFISLQAVKYSRDYKRKYDYFRSKLRKPVSIHFIQLSVIILAQVVQVDWCISQTALFFCCTAGYMYTCYWNEWIQKKNW